MTIEMRYTPGPLAVTGPRTVDGMYEIQTVNGACWTARVLRVADAHLYAGAPRALEALKRCLGMLECYARTDMGYLSSSVLSAMEEGRAAIAAAEGR